MERFEGKVAIVTGASAGIGAAIAESLVKAGMLVVGLARRSEKIEALAKTLQASKGKLYALKTDVSKEEDILQAFKWTLENVGPLHVLINNAGIIGTTAVVNGSREMWKSLLDVNVLGLATASREAIKQMMANDIDGHIININSIVGHKIINMPRLFMYQASKHAVTALTEGTKLELMRAGSKIKVTSLSPGVVTTEIFLGHCSPEELEKLKESCKYLRPEDIAEAAVYILSTPPHVLIKELTIEPLGEA